MTFYVLNVQRVTFQIKKCTIQSTFMGFTVTTTLYLLIMFNDFIETIRGNAFAGRQQFQTVILTFWSRLDRRKIVKILKSLTFKTIINSQASIYRTIFKIQWHGGKVLLGGGVSVLILIVHCIDVKHKYKITDWAATDFHLKLLCPCLVTILST